MGRGMSVVFLLILSPLAAQVVTHKESAVQVTKPSDLEIVLTRTFAAPRQAIFEALTTPNHLLNWMKPATMSLVACEVDLRAGGSHRYVYQRPNRRKLEVHGDYETVEPPHRIVYKESYDFSPLKILVSTVLDEVPDGTVFTQTILYASKQERDDDFDGVASSAKEVYDNLRSYLASLPKP